jgi:Regulator of chromosome condensation (RCC1) repeat
LRCLRFEIGNPFFCEFIMSKHLIHRRVIQRIAHVFVALAASTALLPSLVQAEAPTVLSGGFDFMCALTKTEGTVKCWGVTGASGTGPNTTTSNAVREVIVVSNVVSLASGSGHNCALRSDGAVFCWGDNLYWQVGDPNNGSVRTVRTPQPVVGLPGVMVGVYSGPTANHTCAITAATTVVCWGITMNGSGRSSPVPKDVPGLSGVSKLALGANHTCALGFDGSVKCWGDNRYGQLGEGSYTERPLPTLVTGLGAGVVDISAGLLHTCAVLANGGARCWGQGQNGSLGNGASRASSGTLNPDSNVPVTPTGLGAGAGVTSIVSVDFGNCVTLNTGGVRCWGHRPAGGGDGVPWTGSADIIQPTPVDVVGLSGPVAMLGGSYRYVCAVVVSGAVECWGNRPIDGGTNANGASASAHLGGFSIDTRLTMTEYRHASLDYFFLTSRHVEKLLFKAVAPDFQPTGKSFFVNSTGLLASSKPITRYYFDKVAKAASRGSHFYTLVDAERTALNGLNPGNTTAPKLPYNEGADSFAFTPLVEGVGGSCASGQSPVYRAFRGARFPDDPNHRFTTDLALYNTLVTAGWDGEGVKMCVSP